MLTFVLEHNQCLLQASRLRPTAMRLSSGIGASLVAE